MSVKRNIARTFILNNYPVGVLVIKALVPFKKKQFQLYHLLFMCDKLKFGQIERAEFTWLLTVMRFP